MTDRDPLAVLLEQAFDVWANDDTGASYEDVCARYLREHDVMLKNEHKRCPMCGLQVIPPEHAAQRDRYAPREGT